MAKLSLFQAATSNWQTIPKQAWLLALGVGIISSVSDVANWTLHWHSRLALWIEAVPLVVSWLGAIYFGAMGVLRIKPTAGGYVIFAAATLALMLPAVATIAFVILAKGIIPQAVNTGVLLLGLFCGALVIGLLPAWPVAQAISARCVSPLVILKATRGHRWSLVGLILATSGIGNSKLIPDIAKAKNLGEAALIGAGHAFFGLVPFGFAVGIAASAWEFAVINDPNLVIGEATN